MRQVTIQKLLLINESFYQSFGAAFAETRRRIQPGIRRILDEWIHDGKWLDIGCGSGALAVEWAKRGLKGLYWGIDFSQPLLDEAKKNATGSAELEVQFSRTNLLADDWYHDLQSTAFDGVLAFASLHHLPGSGNRARLLKQVAGLIAPGGLFIHSEWQFQNSPRLVARVQPWQTAGIEKEDLEEGDTLLDWRHTTGTETEKSGLRYVHLFSMDELRLLAGETGFAIIEEFNSDGAGGNLGLYQVWKKLV